MANTSLKDRTYRLMDDRTGESFILVTGKKKNLLVWDEKQKINRAIRHCPNEKEIFIDKQSEHALVVPIIFTNGIFEAKARDVITQQFLDAHPDNAKNGGSWFEELNEENDAQDFVEIDELISKVKNTIFEKSEEEDGIYALEMVASVLLGSLEKVTGASKNELKRVLYLEAQNNPHYFVNDAQEVTIFDDQDLQRTYITLRAIKDGVIKKSTNGRTMLWVKNGKSIFTAATGLDLVEAFAEFLSTDEGLLVMKQIENKS